MPRRLSPEERAAWARVASTVRRAQPSLPVELPPTNAGTRKPAAVSGIPRVAPIPRPPTRAARTSDTLDGGWDKRIAKGALQPDFSIDLHGETLASAHARLNRSLDAAIRRQARVILLVTGKPAPDNPRLPPTSRGVIRASVHDWLAASPHAGRIAAVRGAHPRHGGNGALYVILRRDRS